MLDLNVASNDIKQMLFAFRYFYSSPLRLNILMKADEWKLSDAVKDSDIMGLLKKDINSLKNKYNIYSDSKIKVDYAINKMDELYKLPCDFNTSFLRAFNIAYKSCQMLEETGNFLILKWFVTSFFEKYLQVAAKAFDIYKMATTCIILQLNGLKKQTMSEFVSEIIKTEDVKYLTAEYFCLIQYIKNLNGENALANNFGNEELKYLYKTYLKCRENSVPFEINEFEKLFDDIIHGGEESKDYKVNFMNKIVGDVLKDSKSISDNIKLGMVNTLSDVVILGDLPFEDNHQNRSRFINIVMQTRDVITENEGKHSVSFTIDDDFKMYFVVNKESFKPIFLKKYDDTLTIINYEGLWYLLYQKCDFSNDIYGITLVNWFDEPSSLIKISPDEDGKYVFNLD